MLFRKKNCNSDFKNCCNDVERALPQPFQYSQQSYLTLADTRRSGDGVKKSRVRLFKDTQKHATYSFEVAYNTYKQNKSDI